MLNTDFGWVSGRFAISPEKIAMVAGLFSPLMIPGLLGVDVVSIKCF